MLESSANINERKNIDFDENEIKVVASEARININRELANESHPTGYEYLIGDESLSAIINFITENTEISSSGYLVPRGDLNLTEEQEEMTTSQFIFDVLENTGAFEYTDNETKRIAERHFNESYVSAVVKTIEDHLHKKQNDDDSESIFKQYQDRQ